MTLPVSFPTIGPSTVQSPEPSTVRIARPAIVDPANKSPAGPGKPEISDLGKRFEQMLWTEMLSYAGLDEAFSQGGGEAASNFARYVIESISEDLAAEHPMGIGEAVDRSVAARQAAQQAALQDDKI